MAENDEVGVGSDGDREDKTGKRLPHSKNLDRAKGYLTPNAGQAFIQLK